MRRIQKVNLKLLRTEQKSLTQTPSGKNDKDNIL